MTELKAGHHTLGRASSWLGWMALMVILAVCGPAAAQPFVHPGILNNRAELDFVKGKIKAEAEPWKAHWNKMRSLPISRLTVKPRASANVMRGPYGRPNVGASQLMFDALSASSHAIQWYMTEDQAHAAKAIEILNAYANTLKSVSGWDARLLAGMSGINFMNAAEIVRHTSNQWPEADQKKFREMARNVLYPLIMDFTPNHNGNWDAAMGQTMMAMGVFLDDRAMFNRGMNHALSKETNGSIPMYFNDFGECQENGRDQGHTQMGICYLSCCCEIAWKQGIDIYSTLDNRLFKGFEYTSKFMLGNDVPYQPYRSVDGTYDYKTISLQGRGRFAPIYEIPYHHFHDRMKMEMPYTKQAIEKIRQRILSGQISDRLPPQPENPPAGQQGGQSEGRREGQGRGSRGGSRGIRVSWDHGSWDAMMFGDLPAFPKGYDPAAKK